MDYISRKLLENLFGKDKLRFSSNVVGIIKNKNVSYSKLNIPGVTHKSAVNSLHYLRRKKIIEYREIGNKIKIILTEDGKKKILYYKIDDLDIKEPQKWDSKWHIVAFDIPEKHKSARNALADKMRELGLVLFQKSLWIYPFYCKDEIDFVAEVFNIGKYVHYIIVESITNDKLLRQRFRI